VKPIDRFAAYLETINCAFERVGDDALTAGVEVTLEDEDGEGDDAEAPGQVFDMIVQSDEEAGQLGCYVVWPVQVPAEKLPAAAELIHRANFGVLVGNVELDFDDGEVRAKSGLDVEGVELNDPACQGLVQVALDLTMMYLPALRDVVENGTAVVEALETVEGVS
jgi:hypothetical protein